VAARERFAGHTITEPDGDNWIVKLDPAPPGLNLTHQGTLDLLGVDDRVSTGRVSSSARVDPDPLLETCGRLADAVYDWWHGAPPPLRYRSRTVPESGRNLAFTESSGIPAVAIGRVRDAQSLHANLVLRARFTVPAAWLE
jgi:hypothetical protein